MSWPSGSVWQQVQQQQRVDQVVAHPTGDHETIPVKFHILGDAVLASLHAVWWAHAAGLAMVVGSPDPQSRQVLPVRLSAAGNVCALAHARPGFCARVAVMVAVIRELRGERARTRPPIRPWRRALGPRNAGRPAGRRAGRGPPC